jgi:hypothetical protein
LVASRASTEAIDVFIDLNKGTVYLSPKLFPFCSLSQGKGAFILGCTSPLKAIMIDRPFIGKVKN